VPSGVESTQSTDCRHEKRRIFERDKPIAEANSLRGGIRKNVMVVDIINLARQVIGVRPGLEARALSCKKETKESDADHVLCVSGVTENLIIC
jgi:hypothetical protein